MPAPHRAAFVFTRAGNDKDDKDAKDAKDAKDD
jgi:hypothetical protein